MLLGHCVPYHDDLRDWFTSLQRGSRYYGSVAGSVRVIIKLDEYYKAKLDKWYLHHPH